MLLFSSSSSLSFFSSSSLYFLSSLFPCIKSSSSSSIYLFFGRLVDLLLSYFFSINFFSLTSFLMLFDSKFLIFSLILTSEKIKFFFLVLFNFCSIILCSSSLSIMSFFSFEISFLYSKLLMILNSLFSFSLLSTSKKINSFFSLLSIKLFAFKSLFFDFFFKSIFVKEFIFSSKIKFSSFFLVFNFLLSIILSFSFLSIIPLFSFEFCFLFSLFK